jgi:hypothetical protein
LTAGGPSPSRSGVPDALRSAVERTLDFAGRSARASSSAISPRRGSELLDELARRGRGAREELTKRSGDAREEISRRGGGARDEVGRRLESVERRLASIEELLRGQPKGKP